MPECHIDRETLDEKLRESDYGEKKMLFAAYFKLSGDGSPVCTVCGEPIAAHRSKHDKPGNNNKGGKKSGAGNGNQAKPKQVFVAPSAPVKNEPVEPTRVRASLDMSMSQAHAGYPMYRHLPLERVSETLDVRPWQARTGSFGGAAPAPVCIPWCLLLGPFAMFFMWAQRFEFDHEKREVRNVMRHCLCPTVQCGPTDTIKYNDIDVEKQVVYWGRTFHDETDYVHRGYKRRQDVWLKGGGCFLCMNWDLQSSNDVTPYHTEMWKDYITSAKEGAADNLNFMTSMAMYVPYAKMMN